MRKAIFSLLILFVTAPSFAQGHRNKAATDSAAFAHLLIATKEFKQEKEKMDALFKSTGKVAIAAIEIDMPDEDDAPDPKDPERNIITGYIKEEQGAANVMTYEAKYDKVKRRIVSVTPYNDGVDISVD